MGKFFGVIEDLSGVLQSLIDKKIFDHVEVFNYQALCLTSTLQETDGAFTFDTVSVRI